MDPALTPVDSKLPSSNNPTLSLVGSFLVDISHTEDDESILWSLIPIEEAVASESDAGSLSEGARSWKALHRMNTQQLSKPVISLESKILEPDTLQVQISSSTNVALLAENAKLLSAMAKALAQYTANASDNETKAWNLVIYSGDETKEEFAGVTFSLDDIPTLFEVDSTSGVEIVDMVDQQGNVLAMVPRTLVHSLNILHRGIGLTVSKDEKFSELYVHRRTDFKRIFPSLYDMFVGGVSLSGEEARLTAAREVAEELGLSRALKENQQNLSGPLFQCVVCTAYNRCVVTVFQYTMDPSVETISWQEEEVSWGDFVRYDTAEAAADLSIKRLVGKQEWPGLLPAVQSKWKGNKPPEAETSSSVEDWATWDFVPDGLLVWEAWLKWNQAAHYD
ncbi:Uncharacterized Nudix hydrolase [Seminavis robusta]|uniref:Uncharacterized Nudix hydrolase n=1 Tax=Seminavis robusta TaxID=568900 RepID=A0A9N8HP22_9STRA|nr:Uncharacterized Nudix hydrolase [Seminavis robusta]|eukprot:Sro868_g213260.1 Uncharacterized Nudix hydrolase (393) ;mRNA; f:8693-9871